MTEFPVPQGVHTSVTYPELRLLQKFAHEAGTVLEIGTHYGFTCIGMALAGAHVTSVDPHYEGPADKPDTWEAFLANCGRHGFHMTGNRDLYACTDHTFGIRPSGIEAFQYAIEDPELDLAEERWGMVFIDGNHTWPCPMRDSQIARAHLRAPGYLAFHDVTPNWPGVWRTTEELTRSGEIAKLDQVGTLAVYQVAAYQK